MIRDAHEKEVRHDSVWLFRSIQYTKGDSWLGLLRSPIAKPSTNEGKQP